MSQFDETAQDAVYSKHQGPFEGINVIHEHGYHDAVEIYNHHLIRQSRLQRYQKPRTSAAPASDCQNKT